MSHRGVPRAGALRWEHRRVTIQGTSARPQDGVSWKAAAPDRHVLF